MKTEKEEQNDNMTISPKRLTANVVTFKEFYLQDTKKVNDLLIKDIKKVNDPLIKYVTNSIMKKIYMKLKK